MIALTTLLIAGCSRDGGGGGDEEVTGLAAFGYNSHDISTVNLTVIGTSADGLDVPRDLAFNPDVAGELWVVNQEDDSASIFSGAGTDAQSSQHIVDSYALHFMDEVSSIAFGAATFAGSDSPTFGTCQESNNTYNTNSSGNGFMGPTLWTADLSIFGEPNPAAISYLGYDLGSHLDMLHESPYCVGIAWETDNVYWVFDGNDGSIVRYDFQEDHDVGYDNHSDGIIGRYVEGQVSRVEDVPSHLEYDASSQLLYIADTGNSRIAVLDTASGERGDSLRAKESGTDHYEVDDADLWTLIDGSEVGLGEPSGIALVEDTLLVTDHANGNLFAFSLDGELLDWVDTGLGADALMGITARSLEDIWLVDAAGDQVLRLQP